MFKKLRGRIGTSRRRRQGYATPNGVRAHVLMKICTQRRQAGMRWFVRWDLLWTGQRVQAAGHRTIRRGFFAPAALISHHGFAAHVPARG